MIKAVGYFDCIEDLDDFVARHGLKVINIKHTFTNGMIAYVHATPEQAKIIDRHNKREDTKFTRTFVIAMAIIIGMVIIITAFCKIYLDNTEVGAVVFASSIFIMPVLVIGAMVLAEKLAEKKR
jgi:amino acid permease